MYVRKAYRRRVVGSALLAFLEGQLPMRCCKCQILTSEDDQPALRLYNRRGYQLMEDEAILSKELFPTAVRK